MNTEKVRILWIDEVRKIISTKKIENAKPVRFEGAEKLDRLISGGYKIG